VHDRQCTLWVTISNDKSARLETKSWMLRRLSFLISRKPTCGQSIRGRGFGEFFLRPTSCRLRMASNASTGTVSYFSPSRQVGEVPSFLILRPPRGRDAGGDAFDSHNIIQGWLTSDHLLWRAGLDREATLSSLFRRVPSGGRASRLSQGVV
jgi:hypothetical protein